MKFAGILLATCLMTAPALAAETATSAITTPTPTSSVTPLTLPQNTEIPLTLNSSLSTANQYAGDRFALTVATDVMSGGQVLIPKGTRAVAFVSMAKGKGSFGKSGKMEIMFKYLDMDGKQIPLAGTYYQEGRGNGGAAIGASLALGLVGGLIVKGHQAEIPQGREFTAQTVDAIPFDASPVAGARAAISNAYTPQHISFSIETDKERKERMKRQKADLDAVAKAQTAK